MTDSNDDLLLPGLDGSDEALHSQNNTSSDEAKIEKSQEENPNLITYREMLETAHKALGEQKISDISLSHPYWGLMNTARQFKHEKGL